MTMIMNVLAVYSPTADIDNDHFSKELPETIAMEVIISNRFYLIKLMTFMLMMMRFLSLMSMIMIINDYHGYWSSRYWNPAFGDQKSGLWKETQRVAMQ